MNGGSDMDLDKLNKLTLDDIAENPELYFGDQVEEVEGWLSENVRVFDEPNTVTLSQFDVDWHRFSGSFCLSLDETVIEERISFSVGADGTASYSLPMFHSPLGAPASYNAYEFSKNTRLAISKALDLTIPRLLGAGRHPVTKKEITINSPISERISREELKQAKRRVKKNYKIAYDCGSENA